jgi:D-sedoheptulose 7-phosphate isomerase
MDWAHEAFTAHRQALDLAQKTLMPSLQMLIEDIVDTLNQGGKLLLCGNGGSAADCQHIAAEFTGRFLAERRGLAAIALTTDTSALTAIGNDYGFERIFDRQVEALARPGDVLLGISTSGNSPNVLSALELAASLKCKTWGFSGRDGGQMAQMLGMRNLTVPSSVTARSQEVHILLGHLLCEGVDRAFAPS